MLLDVSERECKSERSGSPVTGVDRLCFKCDNGKKKGSQIFLICRIMEVLLLTSPTSLERSGVSAATHCRVGQSFSMEIDHHRFLYVKETHE